MYFLLVSQWLCLPVVDVGVGYVLHSLRSPWAWLMEDNDPHPSETKWAGGVILCPLFPLHTFLLCEKKPEKFSEVSWHTHHKSLNVTITTQKVSHFLNFLDIQTKPSLSKVSWPAPTSKTLVTQAGFARNWLKTDYIWINKYRRDYNSEREQVVFQFFFIFRVEITCLVRMRNKKRRSRVSWWKVDERRLFPTGCSQPYSVLWRKMRRRWGSVIRTMTIISPKDIVPL